MTDLLLDEERVEAVLDEVAHVGVPEAVRAESRRQPGIGRPTRRRRRSAGPR